MADICIVTTILSPIKEAPGHMGGHQEMVNRYVHFASAQDMIRGKVGSPMDKMGIKKLRSYNIDKMLGAKKRQKPAR